MTNRRGVRTRNLSQGIRSAGSAQGEYQPSYDRSRGVQGIGSICFPPIPPWRSNIGCARSQGIGQGRSQGIAPGRSQGKQHDRSRGAKEGGSIE